MTPPSELTLAIIKPTVCAYRPYIQQVIQRIEHHPSLTIVRSKPFQWSKAEAELFYAEHIGRFYYDRLILGMTSGQAVALALSGPNSISTWREFIGPTKAYRTVWEKPNCLRAQLGIGDTRNGFHGSGSYHCVTMLIQIHLPQPSTNCHSFSLSGTQEVGSNTKIHYKFCLYI